MIIKVKVKPNSSENALIDLGDNLFEARVKDRPIDGKANSTLLKILSKHFNVNYKLITIKNPKGRIKLIEVNNG